MSRRLWAACAQHSCRRGAVAVVKPRRPVCRHGSRGVASPICGSRRCSTSADRCVDRVRPEAAAPEEAKAAMVAAAPFKTARKAELCCMHFEAQTTCCTSHARQNDFQKICCLGSRVLWLGLRGTVQLVATTSWSLKSPSPETLHSPRASDICSQICSRHPLALTLSILVGLHTSTCKSEAFALENWSPGF